MTDPLENYRHDPSVDMSGYVPVADRLPRLPGQGLTRAPALTQTRIQDPGISPMDRKDPKRHFQALGLLNSRGKARLNVAQGYFNRSENVEDLDLLEELYVYWRDENEYLVLRCVQVNPRSLASSWEYIGVKTSKRGNDVYRRRVKTRLNWLSSMPDVTFFTPSDFQTVKKVYSRALWVTLTYDTKRCSRSVAMKNIGREWNQFLSGLRRKYGKISVLRSWEVSDQGYAHVHACLLFHDAKFMVFPYLAQTDKNETQLQFRIREKDDIAALWHSYVDVQAMGSTRKLFNYMKKYQTKTLMAADSPKGVRTMSLLWIDRKRSFSVSGDFRAHLADLIRLLHNSNMGFSQTLLDGSVQGPSVWEFVGVFAGSELEYGGVKWTFSLNRDQIETVLRRESELKAARRWD